MTVTFQRYFYDCRKELSQLYPAMSVAQGMELQFMTELRDTYPCRFLLKKVRKGGGSDPLSRFWEFVVDFPEFEGRSPVDLANYVKENLSKVLGQRGTFCVGDVSFDA